MNRRTWNVTRPNQVTAIAALLIIAIGFCLIHVDHHLGSGNGMCPDPCAKMASTVVDCTGPEPVVTRVGPIPSDEIIAVAKGLTS